MIFALLILAIGVAALVGCGQGEDRVAASFTRVGGPTRVATAVAASHFWSVPPKVVVEMQAYSNAPSRDLMLGAAECAMAHDAPLLFRPRAAKQRGLVDRTIDTWKAASSEPEGMTVKVISDQSHVTECVAEGNPAQREGLSTLDVAERPLLLPGVGVEKKLKRMVVFVVPKTATDVPDVAVGLALAAHLTSPERPGSVVVVPRFLHADPVLEEALREHSELIEGGVVLGQTGILPEDTRAVLREVLRSKDDDDGLLADLQDNLASLETVVAALLALFGAGAAAVAAPALIGHAADRVSEERRERAPWSWSIVRHAAEPTNDARLIWPPDLVGRTVTVGLRSGSRVAARVERSPGRSERFLRLDGARMTGGANHNEWSAKTLFVPVDDIAFVALGVEREPAAGVPKRPVRQRSRVIETKVSGPSFPSSPGVASRGSAPPPPTRPARGVPPGLRAAGRE